MKQEETPRAWARELAEEIGRAVRLVRSRRGLSAEQLSARCTELGHAIPRNTIANLENGRKETVPIHELVILARALGVPPIELLYPVGRAEHVQALPGVEVSPLRAVEWFCGNRLLQDAKSLEIGLAEHDSLHKQTAVGLFREYENYVSAWLDDRARLDALGADEVEERAAWKRVVEDDVAGIRRTHNRCRDLGLEPPLGEHDADVAAELRELVS